MSLLLAVILTIIYVSTFITKIILGSSRGRDHTVVGFTTTCAINAYHHSSCEFESCSWRGVLYTTLCDKVCQWFSLGTPVSSTNKTGHHNVTETQLKVALSGIKHHVSTQWCPTHIVLQFCFLFLCLVYAMLPVSLDCPFFISPSVFFNVYLKEKNVPPISLIHTHVYRIWVGFGQTNICLG